MQYCNDPIFNLSFRWLLFNSPKTHLWECTDMCNIISISYLYWRWNKEKCKNCQYYKRLKYTLNPKTFKCALPFTANTIFRNNSLLQLCNNLVTHDIGQTDPPWSFNLHSTMIFTAIFMIKFLYQLFPSQVMHYRIVFESRIPWNLYLRKLYLYITMTSHAHKYWIFING